VARTRNAKSYRERRKTARVARKGIIEASGKYREEAWRSEGAQRNINTRMPIIIMSE
jgi:hypothetical protein